MRRVEFLFDFGSPNAFLAYRVIPAIEKRTGAHFELKPVLLGGIFKATNNRSPVEAFAGIRNKLAYENLETQRFVRHHNISDFKSNPFFPVNTLQLMRLAVAAQIEGFLPRYMDVVFHHMWVEPKKMDDPAIVRDVLSQSDIEPSLWDRAQMPEVKAALQAKTEDAVNRGVFGIPSFFVDEELYFGKDRLAQVEEAIVNT